MSKNAADQTRIDFDPHRASMERLIDAWIPLTFAANSLNRSMGLPDLYPFVLSPPATSKLAFVHARIHAQAEQQTKPNRSIRTISPVCGDRLMACNQF